MDASEQHQCRSARTWCSRGIRFVDAGERPPVPETSAPLQAAIDKCDIRTRRWPRAQKHPEPAAEEFSPAASRDTLLRFPRVGLYARLLRPATRYTGRRVQGDQLPRGPRLLPQVHRGRAHAADHPQPRAAGGRRRPTATSSAAARRGRSIPNCWCSCCSTTSETGDDEDHPAESTHMAGQSPSGSSSTRSRARIVVSGRATI